MKQTVVALILAASSLSAAQSAAKSQTFTGIISDSMCEGDGHQAMRMGPTDGECAQMCVLAHGAFYVLVSGKNVYTLNDQKAPEQFAGARVRVVGTLDAKTQVITVASITAAK